MTTISKSTTPTGNDGSTVVQWGPLANDDDGESIPFAHYAAASIQVAGVFGAGGSVRLEGSNDGGANWSPLTDHQGNALDFTSAKLRQVTEVAALTRPRVTTGDGSTAVTISLCMRESS